MLFVSNLTPEPPLAPPSQAVEERDGLKASLAATNDELAKSKAKANALDVSVVQHGASVDRLKVRERSLARENPRQTHARTHPLGRTEELFFFFFSRKRDVRDVRDRPMPSPRRRAPPRTPSLTHDASLGTHFLFFLHRTPG